MRTLGGVWYQGGKRDVRGEHQSSVCGDDSRWRQWRTLSGVDNFGNSSVVVMVSGDDNDISMSTGDVV